MDPYRREAQYGGAGREGYGAGEEGYAGRERAEGYGAQGYGTGAGQPAGYGAQGYGAAGAGPEGYGAGGAGQPGYGAAGGGVGPEGYRAEQGGHGTRGSGEAVGGGKYSERGLGQPAGYGADVAGGGGAQPMGQYVSVERGQLPTGGTYAPMGEAAVSPGGYPAGAQPVAQGGVVYEGGAGGQGGLPHGAKLKHSLITRKPVVKYHGHKYKGTAAIEKQFGVRID